MFYRLTDGGDKEFVSFVSEFGDAVKAYDLNVVRYPISFFLKNFFEHISMIIRVSEHAVKGQCAVRISVQIEKFFQEGRLVVAADMIQIVGFYMVLFAGMEIPFFSFVGFSRENGVEADINRMTAAEFQEFFDRQTCA